MDYNGRNNYGNNDRQRGKSSRQHNPPDPDGNPVTCHICSSIFHFAGSNGQGCPESYENLQAAYEVSLEKREAKDANEVCRITQEQVLMSEVRYKGL